MNLKLQPSLIALEAGEVFTVDDAEGMRILARSGTVWVTEEGDRADHIVGPGDTLTIAHPGRTVVQALEPAWISLGEGPRAANDNLEQGSHGAGFEPTRPPRPAEDFIDDLRFRIQNRTHLL
jgi:hypothetical protein